MLTPRETQFLHHAIIKLFCFVLAQAGGRLVHDEHARAFALSALAISTICWRPSEESANERAPAGNPARLVRGKRAELE